MRRHVVLKARYTWRSFVQLMWHADLCCFYFTGISTTSCSTKIGMGGTSTGGSLLAYTYLHKDVDCPVEETGLPGPAHRFALLVGTCVISTRFRDFIWRPDRGMLTSPVSDNRGGSVWGYNHHVCPCVERSFSSHKYVKVEIWGVC